MIPSASLGTAERYGLRRVCRISGLARSTTYDFKARKANPTDQRPAAGKRGPIGAASEDELVGHILIVPAGSPIHG